jgi:hypothetical protein
MSIVFSAANSANNLQFQGVDFLGLAAGKAAHSIAIRFKHTNLNKTLTEGQAVMVEMVDDIYEDTRPTLAFGTSPVTDIQAYWAGGNFTLFSGLTYNTYEWCSIILAYNTGWTAVNVYLKIGNNETLIDTIDLSGQSATIDCSRIENIVFGYASRWNSYPISYIKLCDFTLWDYQIEELDAYKYLERTPGQYVGSPLVNIPLINSKDEATIFPAVGFTFVENGDVRLDPYDNPFLKHVDATNRVADTYHVSIPDGDTVNLTTQYGSPSINTVAGTYGDCVRFITGASANAISLDDPSGYYQSENCEILGSFDGSVFIMTRGSGGATSRNGYRLGVYSGGIEIGKFVDNTYTSLAVDAGFTVSSPYYVRARTIGNELKIKAWNALSPEPKNWTLEVIDNTYLEGWIGLYSYSMTTDLYTLKVSTNLTNKKCVGISAKQANVLDNFDRLDVYNPVKTLSVVDDSGNLAIKPNSTTGWTFWRFKNLPDSFDTEFLCRLRVFDDFSATNDGGFFAYFDPILSEGYSLDSSYAGHRIRDFGSNLTFENYPTPDLDAYHWVRMRYEYYETYVRIYYKVWGDDLNLEPQRWTRITDYSTNVYKAGLVGIYARDDEGYWITDLAIAIDGETARLPDILLGPSVPHIANTATSFQITIPEDANFLTVTVSGYAAATNLIGKLNFMDTPENVFTLIAKRDYNGAAEIQIETWKLSANDVGWPGAGTHTLYAESLNSYGEGFIYFAQVYFNVQDFIDTDYDIYANSSFSIETNIDIFDKGADVGNGGIFESNLLNAENGLSVICVYTYNGRGRVLDPTYSDQFLAFREFSYLNAGLDVAYEYGEPNLLATDLGAGCTGFAFSLNPLPRESKHLKYFEDNFNRADGNLGQNWIQGRDNIWSTEFGNQHSIEILGNQVYIRRGNNPSYVYVNPLKHKFSPNQSSEIDYSISGAWTSPLIVLRASGFETTFTGYEIDFDYTNDTLEFYEVINGVSTLIGDTVSINLQQGDRIKAKIFGETIFAYINDVLIATRHSSTISEGQPGFGLRKGSDSNHRLDNFYAEEIDQKVRYEIDAITLQSSAPYEDVYVYIPPTANAIVVDIAGWSGQPNTTPVIDRLRFNDTTIQNDFTLIRQAGYFDNDSNTSVASYIMLSTDVNWPGPGYHRLYMRAYNNSVDEGYSYSISAYSNVDLTLPVLSSNTEIHGQSAPTDVILTTTFTGSTENNLGVLTGYVYSGDFWTYPEFLQKEITRLEDFNNAGLAVIARYDNGDLVLEPTDSNSGLTAISYILKSQENYLIPSISSISAPVIFSGLTGLIITGTNFGS